MTRVAFVGLGAMGEPMATNLLKKGFDVTVVGHRRPEPVERLKALGAKIASAPAAAAAHCDVAVLMLPASPQVEAAITGEGGLAEAMLSGSVIVDCSTSNPKSTRALAAMLKDKGVGFVDAGVTRGVAGAKGGTLAYFIGGTEADLEKAKPVLDAMGDTYYHMGPVGSGHETKNLSNGLSYATVALVSETLMLGEHMGLDLDKLHTALMGGAPSKALEAFGPTIIARKYAPVRVSVVNARSHLNVTKEIGEDAGLVLFPEVLARYDQVADKGYTDEDMSAIAELWPKG